MKYIRYIMFLISIIFDPLQSKDIYTNSLSKVFFHQGQVSDKIVCYFTKEPICNHLPQMDRDLSAGNVPSKKHVRFFIPLTTILDEARSMLPKIDAHEPYYTISFNEVKKPLEGVQVSIAYDPHYIGFEFETFDAIHTHKGVVFKFHYKHILQELNKKTDHLLQFAHNTTSMPTVVIDNGHGGSDLGKVGNYAVQEKDINLQVGTQVAEMLKKKGYNVVFTRETDIFVPLDQRTTRANTIHADLFVSIHANSSLEEKVSGLETYWSPQTLLKDHVSDLDEQSRQILTHITQKRDCASKKLAFNLHNNVLMEARKMYALKDRNVKESVSQVLLGTDMPAALIELGFLSNKKETSMLMQNDYQQVVACGICAGIESYLKEV